MLDFNPTGPDDARNFNIWIILRQTDNGHTGTESRVRGACAELEDANKEIGDLLNIQFDWCEVQEWANECEGVVNQRTMHKSPTGKFTCSIKHAEGETTAAVQKLKVR